MDPFELTSFGLGLANTAYNLYTNKRDFDYQKALQQQIFNREDTAVKRRMDDLKNAGINPNLATGQGAGAGAVVSRSNTNDVDMGSALDMIQAVNNIKQQKQQVKNLKDEGDILSYKKEQEERNNQLDFALTLKSLGFNPDIYLNKDGTFSFGYQSGKPTQKNMFFDQLDYQYDNLKNSAELLSKQNNWYTANQIVDVLTSGVGAVTGGINAGANLKRANNAIKRFH